MSRRRLLFSIVLIIGIAAFFRLYKINSLPGGLFPDEAANGLDILLMEDGHLQPFYERGNGREALFFYMLWASVKAFGVSPAAHHGVSAVVGTLAVAACIYAAYQIFRFFSDDKKKAMQIALLSGLLMAINAWHVVLSRTAFRANLIPLFSALSIGLFLHAIRENDLKKKLLLSFGFGGVFALGFYTYIAYRMMPFIILGIVAIPLFVWAYETKLKKLDWWKWISSIVVTKLSFILFIFPLAYYFFTHPGSFIGRSGQVSIFNPELNGGDLIGTLFAVTKSSLLGYITQGDFNWRHNISEFPFISPIISWLLIIGLLVALYKAITYFFYPIAYKKYYPYLVLIIWFFAMLAPVVTTAEGIPHGLRSIGTIPAVFIITATGLLTVTDWIKHCFSLRNDRFAILFSFILISSVMAQSYWLYFVKAASNPANFYSFRSDLTVVSDYLKVNGRIGHTFLVLDKFSVQSTDYLTTVNLDTPSDLTNRRYTQVDPEQVYKIKDITTIQKGDEVVFTQSSMFDITKFKQSYPSARLIKEERNKFGQAVLAVYKF